MSKFLSIYNFVFFNFFCIILNITAITNAEMVTKNTNTPISIVNKKMFGKKS